LKKRYKFSSTDTNNKNIYYFNNNNRTPLSSLDPQQQQRSISSDRYDFSVDSSKPQTFTLIRSGNGLESQRTTVIQGRKPTVESPYLFPPEQPKQIRHPSATTTIASSQFDERFTQQQEGKTNKKYFLSIIIFRTK